MSPVIRALVVDWGGVLTAPLDGAMAGWAEREGVALAHFWEVMAQWRDPLSAYSPESPVHQLETGDLSAAAFERELAFELAARGSTVDPTGLLARVLAGLQPLDPDMLRLVRRARQEGLQTALLSNSWGEHYPDDLWADLFDVVVISGRVGLRKPMPRIFRHVCDLLGLTPPECVMVDDAPGNVQAACDVGMLGVLHRSHSETVSRLAALGVCPATGGGAR